MASSSDPSVLLSDLLAAIATRNIAAQKRDDAVANQTKVLQEAAAATKAANAALVTATAAQTAAHKALADLLATLEGTATPSPPSPATSKHPPAPTESMAPPAELPTA